MSYVTGGVPSQLTSNTVVTSLETLIDVDTTAVAARAGTLPSDEAGYIYSFTVGNGGNTNDRFQLSAGFADQTAPVSSLWLDINQNGVRDAGIDTLIDPANSVVTLASGASAHILVYAAAAGDMQLTATSLNDDATAVVRRRSATDHIAAGDAPRHGGNTVTLTKTQIIDTQGAAAPGTGTLITYVLTAHVPAAAAVSRIRVTDTVPAGTTYVAGSLSLDGAPLSDAANFDTPTRSISVALPGDALDPVVSFQVRIN